MTFKKIAAALDFEEREDVLTRRRGVLKSFLKESVNEQKIYPKLEATETSIKSLKLNEEKTFTEEKKYPSSSQPQDRGGLNKLPILSMTADQVAANIAVKIETVRDLLAAFPKINESRALVSFNRREENGGRTTYSRLCVKTT